MNGEQEKRERRYEEQTDVEEDEINTSKVEHGCFIDRDKFSTKTKEH